MSTESKDTSSSQPPSGPAQWRSEQLDASQQLAANANRALQTGNLDAAHAILMEASAVLDMVDDQDIDAVLELRAQISNEFGFLFQRVGDLDKAYTYHLKGVQCCDTLLERGAAFRTNTTATLINLAGVCAQQEKFEEGHSIIVRASELISDYLKENTDSETAFNMGFGAFHTRALIENSLGKFEEADASGDQSLIYAEKTFEGNLNFILQAANAFQQLAVQFFNLDQTDQAIKWGAKSETLARQAFDIEKEPAVPVFVQTQLFLILFHETKGNYSDAEDALYNAIDVIGNHPQLLDRGRHFYQQARKQTDKRLNEGGLPRDEVEDGLKEIESRIEAYGGEEKLAQVLQQMQGE